MAKKASLEQKEQVVQAMRPDFFSSIKSIRRKAITKDTGLTEEEQGFYEMALTDGWKNFENTADELLREIDMQIEMSIANGDSKEKIGENTIISVMVKQVVRALLNKVNDAREQAESRDE